MMRVTGPLPPASGRSLFLSFFLSFQRKLRENGEGKIRETEILAKAKFGEKLFQVFQSVIDGNTIAAVHTSASITAGKQIDADEDNFPKINEPTKSKTAKLGGSEDGKRL
jgi:hypothetical protein